MRKTMIGPRNAKTMLWVLFILFALSIVAWSRLHYDDKAGYCIAGAMVIFAFLLFKGVVLANVIAQYIFLFLCVTFPLAALNPEIAVSKISAGFTLWHQILILMLCEVFFFILIFLLKASRPVFGVPPI